MLCGQIWGLERPSNSVKIPWLRSSRADIWTKIFRVQACTLQTEGIRSHTLCLWLHSCPWYPHVPFFLPFPYVLDLILFFLSFFSWFLPLPHQQRHLSWKSCYPLLVENLKASFAPPKAEGNDRKKNNWLGWDEMIYELVCSNPQVSGSWIKRKGNLAEQEELRFCLAFQK